MNKFEKGMRKKWNAFCEWWRRYKKIHNISLITYGTIFSVIIILLVNCFESLLLCLLKKLLCLLGKELIKQGFISIISIMIVYWVDKWYRNYKMKTEHFPRTYRIIKKDIPLSLSNHSLFDITSSENKKIDKIIKSPLEYANQILSGNLAPKFNPNEDYLYKMFTEDITNIVAITAENPNLWLDPTLCFYMSNCSAASLLHHARNHASQKLTTLILTMIMIIKISINGRQM